MWKRTATEEDIHGVPTMTVRIRQMPTMDGDVPVLVRLIVACGGESGRMTRAKNNRGHALGQRLRGQRIKVDLVAQYEEERAPRRNDRGSDAAWESPCGGDKAFCWKNNENAMWKELQEDETHGGRRQSWARDSVNEKLVETDDGERRSMWRGYHGNLAVCKDDRGSAI